MPALPQLVNVNDYRACAWDLAADPAGRAYWLDHFIQHLDVLTDHIAEQYPSASADAVARFREDYLAIMHGVHDDPNRHGRLDILRLDQLRHDVLVRHGFEDPFLPAKTREDAAALKLLPDLLTQLDALPADQQLEHLAVGLMAGNLFDLGAMAMLDRFTSGDGDFWQDRAAQPPRPWFIDHVDAFAARIGRGRPYRHLVWFVDNAGSDIVLGVLPMVRWLLGHGTRVTLAANSRPALNDITATELPALLESAAAIDRRYADPELRIVASGGDAPLLDLTLLSEECVAAARDADLIWLHGMGRALESNFTARLCCDAVRTAVIKDESIAGYLGAQVRDCVFRFDEVST